MVKSFESDPLETSARRDRRRIQKTSSVSKEESVPSYQEVNNKLMITKMEEMEVIITCYKVLT